MEQIKQGIPGVHCILDDMIVTGIGKRSSSITEVQPQGKFGKISVSTKES
jgi:hypothetical protein